MFGTSLLFIGLALPWRTIGLGLSALGVAGFFLIPWVTDWLIERKEGSIRSATKDNAVVQLDALGKGVLFTAFAPDAWVTLQRGRLLLAQGDGRTAAMSFADTARILRQPERPGLVSARAHALMLAGDRAGARELLAEMAERNELCARDRLDFGVIMLGEAARAEQAREHLEAAHSGLDGHPQAAAALAVALARDGESERAMELLATAEAEVDDADELARDSIKRARKALRPARDAAKKKKRKG